VLHGLNCAATARSRQISFCSELIVKGDITHLDASEILKIAIQQVRRLGVLYLDMKFHAALHISFIARNLFFRALI
jgi:hypothetical protein